MPLKYVVYNIFHKTGKCLAGSLSMSICVEDLSTEEKQLTSHSFSTLTDLLYISYDVLKLIL